MSENLRKTILMFLGIVCAVDVFTTVVGLYVVIVPTIDRPVSYLMVFGPAIVILVFLLLTETIFSKNEIIHKILRPFWVICIGYDLYTSFAANVTVVNKGVRYILESIDIIAQIQSIGLNQLFIVILSTMLLTGATVLLPYILHKKL